MKILTLILVLILGLVVACSSDVSQNNQVSTSASDIISDSGTIEVYEIGGEPTDLAHLSIPFIQDYGNMFISITADLNGDGTKTLIVENMPAKARDGGINRFAINVSEGISENVVANVYFSDLPNVELDENNFQLATLQVTTVDVDDEIAISAPGASPDLKRGSFIPLVLANPQDGVSEREGEIPDLEGGPMDCFPIATANNLISLANTHGLRDKLPQDPKDMVDELKDDMQFDDGVLKQNFMQGKQAFVDRYKLPITTTQIDRPSYDDLDEALAQDCAVEISTTFLRSRSGKPDTGHVITGVGVSTDGDDVRIMVHDPATRTGDDVYETQMTGGDSPFILIKDYPFWDGIMIVDAIYVQCYDEELALSLGYNVAVPEQDARIMQDGPGNEVTTGQDAQETVMRSIDTLLIDDKHYPSAQFRIGSHTGEGCSKDHYHADSKVFSLETPDDGLSDPRPAGCGFGAIEDVPLVSKEIPEQEFLRWAGLYLPD